MSYHGLPNDAVLLIVRHPEVGNSSNGQMLCEQVRSMLSRHRGPVLFYHDASVMTNASFEYALRFRELDEEMKDRMIEAVCAVPATVPRIMALTVSKVSMKKWTILKSCRDAVKLLSSKGVNIDAICNPEGDVQLIDLATAS